MNTEIHKMDIGREIKGIIVEDEKLTVKFDEGNLILSSYHSQDCCESVYADFSIMKYHEGQFKEGYMKNLVIKKVSEMGVLLCFDMKYETIKIFIPCYNSQNGYYSSNLELQIEFNGTATKIDISDAVEDKIS